MRFVSILMQSKSDYEIMKHCAKTFDKFNVKYETVISSKEQLNQCITDLQNKGSIAFISTSEISNNIAQSTIKPVITLQNDEQTSHSDVNEGMPVGMLSFGKSGAVNAAYLAMQILAINDKELAIKLIEDRIVQAKMVSSDFAEIEVVS